MAMAEAEAVVLIASEAYAVGLAGALASVVRFAPPGLTIFVVDTGLTSATRAQLQQVPTVPECPTADQYWPVLAAEPLCAPRPVLMGWPPTLNAQVASISWLSSNRCSKAMPDSQMEMATFLKLFLHDLIPQHVRRVLYLDADVIATVSLAPLLAANVGGRSPRLRQLSQAAQLPMRGCLLMLHTASV